MDNLPDFQEEKKLWKKGYSVVIGVDEVGRGCFAGPIVAGAVAFPSRHPDRVPTPSGRVEGSHSAVFGLREIPRQARNDTVKIDDSKRLKPHERKIAAEWIKKNCLAYGIGEVGVGTINKVGIGKATEIAMRKAIADIISNIKIPNSKQTQNSKFKNSKHLGFGILNLEFTKTFVLVDAFHIKYLRGVGLANQKAIIKGDQKSISIAAASIIAKVYRDSLMQKLTKRYRKYHWAKNKGYGTKLHQQAIISYGTTSLHRQQFIQTFLLKQIVI